jgi:hypothetical protein
MFYSVFWLDTYNLFEDVWDVKDEFFQMLGPALIPTQLVRLSQVLLARSVCRLFHRMQSLL